MSILNWNGTPTYKGNQPQPAQQTGLLAGLGTLLGGGGTAPAYKTLNGTSAQAPASSASWWPSLFAPAAPVYKTAPQVVPDSSSPDVVTADEADDAPDPTCVCDDQANTVVIL